MITVKRYAPEYKIVWDGFIDTSKNGTFMLKRDYMDYHSDRFKDFSLMFYDDDRLAAVMPASLHGNEVRSHGGLTYGGIISDYKMTVQKMLELFETFRTFLKSNEIKRLVYKCVPAVYHLYPADEDLYALFRNGARLFRRDVSTTVYLPEKIKFSELRRRGIKKALKNNLVVRQTENFNGYINLLSAVLEEHHGVKPVHSAEELKLLASRFPDVIKLFGAYNNENQMMAGVVIFDTPQVVHAQYIANSDAGRNVGALDLVMDYLINQYSVGKKYFDFGISTENNGSFLNTGLIAQKEGFGGRAVVYDFYELDI